MLNSNNFHTEIFFSQINALLVFLLINGIVSFGQYPDTLCFYIIINHKNKGFYLNLFLHTSRNYKKNMGPFVLIIIPLVYMVKKMLSKKTSKIIKWNRFLRPEKKALHKYKPHSKFHYILLTKYLRVCKILSVDIWYRNLVAQ